ncbi:M20 family metallopeptidase [Granulicella paludicola]|uniref:M20 family metallopeptidase n=1 Tax=Granulicella paludicola TaxID=474951 RepID=UPI0021E0622E|nr:M20 family metallopeptidase [Granulicella paludicola]
MNELERVVEGNAGRLKARLRELVEVESPSEDKAAVDRANALVESWVGDLGGKVKRHRQKAFGDVLEIRFGPARSKKARVLLLGHLDTVWPMGTLAKMPWREAEGKIFGPGVLDMKVGVVMALEAIAAVQALGMDRPVTLLLNSDEEVGSPVSRAITERVAKECAAVFVMEPAQGLAYKTARKGVGHFELKVEGVGSHAGVDFERGHSAVLEMAGLVQRVSAMTDLKRGLTVNVGVVHGGTRSNVVASECSAEVDVRIVKASDAARVEKMFYALKTADKACRLTVSGGINRPPMERKAGTIALFKQARKLAAEMGFVLDEAATGGGSDGNFTAALGVATLDGMGAVGAGAHAAHEHIVAAHVVERTALLAGMVAGV